MSWRKRNCWNGLPKRSGRGGGGWRNNNHLQTLPAEIGQLVNLTEFNLSRNQLTAVPPEIGQLVNLTELGLRDNKDKHVVVTNQ